MNTNKPQNGEEQPHIDVRYGSVVYRFFGRGKWQVKRGIDANYEPINGIYIPRGALKIAASHCKETPFR